MNIECHMKKLILFPYNGNALEAIDCINDKYEIVGFIDDDLKKQNKKVNGFRIYSRDVLFKFPEAKILIVPGNAFNYLHRKQIIDGLKIGEKRFITLIHPNTTISPLAKIGKNVLIMAGVVITSNAIISNHTCILPNTVIHHDVKIGEYNLVGSNVTIAGNTIIHNNCYIGSGSNIIDHIEIGDNSLVGLGSNVICSVRPNSRVVGNPMRYI